jgi:hypothetical protein
MALVVQKARMAFIFIIMMKNAAFIADRPAMGMVVCRHQPENMFMGMVQINVSTAVPLPLVWDASIVQPAHMKNNLL